VVEVVEGGGAVVVGGGGGSVVAVWPWTSVTTGRWVTTMVDVGDDVETGLDVGVEVVPMSMTLGIDTCGVELADIAMPRTKAVTSTAVAARPRHAHRRVPV
jgi:hypothetical protein